MENLVGYRIKTRRKELGITGSKIKEETGISTGNLSDIERGKVYPSALALIELSRILECSTDYLLLGETRKGEEATQPNLTTSQKTLLNFFDGIPEDEQKELLMIAQLKYDRAKRQETSSNLSSEITTSEIA